MAETLVKEGDIRGAMRVPVSEFLATRLSESTIVTPVGNGFSMEGTEDMYPHSPEMAYPSNHNGDLPRSSADGGRTLRSRGPFQPQIDTVYNITQKDGTLSTGEVLATRQNSRTGATEYFVHYEGQNRRLDEWISLDRFREDPVVPPTTPTTPLPSTRGGRKCVPGIAAVVPDPSGKTDGKPKAKWTRQTRRKFDEINHIQPSLAELAPSQASLERLHEERTKVKYIDRVIFGRYDIDTWYFSPYPDDYGRQEVLYICEFCVKYMKHRKSYKFHKCPMKNPPGRQIYYKDNLSYYEVDGKEAKVYCQCLCLLAKLFLDHKTLYFDVESFMFYILTEHDEDGVHIVGYFSKEKDSLEGNNLACIMTLPPYQRKGYGKFLIDFSYELSRKENTVGSPEKPLSDLGKLSYRSYWSWRLLEALKEGPVVSVQDLSRRTFIREDDIIDTLQTLNLCKYWKGQHVLCVKQNIVEECLAMATFQPPKLLVDRNCVVPDWQPPPKPPRLSARNHHGAQATPVIPLAMPTPPVSLMDVDTAAMSDEAEPEPDHEAAPEEPAETVPAEDEEDEEENDDEDEDDDGQGGESEAERDMEVDSDEVVDDDEEGDEEWDRDSANSEDL